MALGKPELKRMGHLSHGALATCRCRSSGDLVLEPFGVALTSLTFYVAADSAVFFLFVVGLGWEIPAPSTAIMGLPNLYSFGTQRPALPQKGLGGVVVWFVFCFYTPLSSGKSMSRS